MKLSRIYFNPEIYYGQGAVSCLNSLSQEKLLILLSKTIKDSEYYKTVQSYFTKKSIKEEIIPHPNRELVTALKDKYLNDIPDVIVAIGGGKVIDTAKCLRFMLNNPTVEFSVLHKVQFSENNDIKLIAVPTTPSTGSEANAVAVITFEDGTKVPYFNDGFLPDMAVLDYSFLQTLSIDSLYTLAADIFTHAVEGITSIAQTPFLKALATTCLSLLESGFRKLKETPNEVKALEDIYCAGYLGGIVLGNAYVGACHALSHALEKQLGGSHSNHIISIIKPLMVWSKNLSMNPSYDEFLRIYESIGFDDYVNRDALSKVNIEQWIEDSAKDLNMKFNSIKMTKDTTANLVDFIFNYEKTTH